MLESCRATPAVACSNKRVCRLTAADRGHHTHWGIEGKKKEATHTNTTDLLQLPHLAAIEPNKSTKHHQAGI